MRDWLHVEDHVAALWRVCTHGRLEDEVYKNYAFDASNFSNVVLNFVGTPRTIGADVIITF